MKMQAQWVYGFTLLVRTFQEASVCLSLSRFACISYVTQVSLQTGSVESNTQQRNTKLLIPREPSLLSILHGHNAPSPSALPQPPLAVAPDCAPCSSCLGVLDSLSTRIFIFVFPWIRSFVIPPSRGGHSADSFVSTTRRKKSYMLMFLLLITTSA